MKRLFIVMLMLPAIGCGTPDDTQTIPNHMPTAETTLPVKK
ncbi:MAG: hypothetical protein ACJZ8Y_12385 [Pirellulaceae bacterium]